MSSVRIHRRGPVKWWRHLSESGNTYYLNIGRASFGVTFFGRRGLVIRLFSGR